MVRSAWLASACLALCCGAGSALAEGRYELASTEPQPNSVVAEWKVDVAAGRMALATPFGNNECTWSELPAVVDLKGFDITLNTTATSIPPNTISGYLVLKSGFGTFEGQNEIEVRSKDGVPVNGSVSLHVSPTSFDFAKPGDKIYVQVSGCDAGQVVYTYEFRN